ncbi:hypothetical protein IWZ00DRAFT_493161 [Phyllosticta capitalensis]|uniref:Glycosyl transferase CAP10 domain-containing protein n=1 Tax=Phyllosticta capitalensis TaxID=121624 RepID=A0ABR1YBA0_9PEZI
MSPRGSDAAQQAGALLQALGSAPDPTQDSFREDFESQPTDSAVLLPSACPSPWLAVNINSAATPSFLKTVHTPETMFFYNYWRTLEEWKMLENGRNYGRFPLIAWGSGDCTFGPGGDSRIVAYPDPEKKYRGCSFTHQKSVLTAISGEYSRVDLRKLRPNDEPTDATPWQYLDKPYFERHCPEYLRHQKIERDRLVIDLPVSRCGLNIFRDWWYENKLPVFRSGHHLYRSDSEAAAFEAYVCGRMLRAEERFIKDVFNGIFEMYVDLEDFRPDPSHLLRAINHLSPSREVVRGILDLFAQMDPVAFWLEASDCVPPRFWDEAYMRLTIQRPQAETQTVTGQQLEHFGAANLAFRPA